jgi:hypothetical protein
MLTGAPFNPLSELGVELDKVDLGRYTRYFDKSENVTLGTEPEDVVGPPRSAYDQSKSRRFA